MLGLLGMHRTLSRQAWKVEEHNQDCRQAVWHLYPRMEEPGLGNLLALVVAVGRTDVLV